MHMPKTFELQVVTVSATLFEGEARELHCKGADGELTVLAHHEPLITTLHPSTIRIVDSEGAQHEHTIAGGALEVANNRCVVLCSRNV